jgi:hypothetical protein
MKTFLIRYRYNGADWCIHMPAEDFDDAKARLARLTNAKIDGEVMLTIPAFTGPLASILVGFRNTVSRLLKTPA